MHINTDDLRHCPLEDFLKLAKGLAIDKIIELFRCCERTVRNYLCGRAPIAWHRAEILRQWLHKNTNESAVPADSALHEVLTEYEENLAWVSATAPNYVSSERSFINYVRGWNVRDKIARAKANGSWRAILRQWRETLTPEFRVWRTSGRFYDFGEPVQSGPFSGQSRFSRRE
jgi:hypothetical protein